MKVCEKIVIDLTKAIANIGVPIRFCEKVSLDSSLLPYPNAKLSGVEVDFSVTAASSDVEVEGNIVCNVEGLCDRCLDDVQKQFVLQFSQLFVKEETAEDGDCYVYSGSKLDVTKAVEDEIVLSLPTLLLCKENCAGLCPVCGVNRNTTQCGCDTQKENAFSSLKNLKF